MFAKGIDLIAANVVTHRFEDSRMGDHHRRRLVMHYLLRLLVKRDAAAVILFGARGIDQLFKRLIAPFGGVGAAVGGGTAEQRTKEVIRVAGGVQPVSAA